MHHENVYGMKLSPYITEELQKKHPELCYMFRVFLKKWVGGEFWKMWMEVERFKEEEEEREDEGKADPIATRIAATQIFDKYWAPSSEYHIGITTSSSRSLF